MLNATVATITLARDAGEERLIHEAIRTLSQAGLEVVIADGGSPARFVDAVRILPHVEVHPSAHSGLVGQVQSAVSTAARKGAPWILYTEPDKLAFFTGGLSTFLDAAAARASAAIVIAARSEKALATFPPTQRVAESTFNRLFAEAVGVDGDCLYGPFLFRTDLVEDVRDIDRSLGWGWRPYLFARSLRRGLDISFIVDDFFCPDDQQPEGATEKLHRIRQLNQNLTGLLAGVRPLG
jgi:hypothetical protein